MRGLTYFSEPEIEFVPFCADFVPAKRFDPKLAVSLIESVIFHCSTRLVIPPKPQRFLRMPRRDSWRLLVVKLRPMVSICNL